MCTYYYTVSAGVDSYTAGVKAPSDMCEIMRQRGYQPIYLYEYIRGRVNIFAKLKKLYSWIGLSLKVKRQSYIVMQYPYNLTTMAEPFIRMLQKWKCVKFIFLLHDIDSIRAYNKDTANRQEKILPGIDYLICHNEAMKEYLISRGIKSEKIFSLGIFDYLHHYDISDLAEKRKNNQTVIIAGNLNMRKSPYLEKLLKSERNYTLHLYGPNFLPSSVYTNYSYFGQIDPGELPSKLEGSFGLVWDGDSLETCEGSTGQYLRFNNPHKVSLYISSCIPVVVWSQSAIADYIQRNHLGLTINSITELNSAICNLDEQTYNTMIENVRIEAEKITHGWFLSKALDQIENMESRM